jgi:glutathione synthase/RimK-type ligase-like ATP-grasp enzyme
MVRILLTDGYGLTARQTVGPLGRAGHTVDILSPPGLTLTRLTRWVNTTHDVPPFGDDPFSWYRTVLDIVEHNDFDVLLPVQEEITMLARHPELLHALGVGIALPPFDSLKRIQDKLTASETLRTIGLPQPMSTAVASTAELLGRRWDFPVFVKLPIGTASTTVYRVDDPAALRQLAAELDRTSAFRRDGVLVQRYVPGPLVMIVAAFDNGRLVGWHACRRVRESLNGGSSAKRSVTLPQVAGHLEALGAELRWHGALALDAILAGDELYYIDVNPRLVEPGNAQHSGVDLLSALLDISSGGHPARIATGRPDVATHQLLLAVLHSATRGRTRIAAELGNAVLHRGHYRHSTEELTPLRNDPLAALPLVTIGASVLADPTRAVALTTGAVGRYSLSPANWRRICGPTPFSATGRSQ